MNKRKYGDDMIAVCAADLASAGVPIDITKSSGSSYGDCDAKMVRGGLMLEGKASYTNLSVIATYNDLKKARKQAKEHGRIAILVVQNSKGSRWAFMAAADAERTGVAWENLIFPPEGILDLKTKSWRIPSDPRSFLYYMTNVDGEEIVAARWPEFVERISEVWSDDTGDNDGKEEGQEKRKSFKNRGFR